MARCVKSNNVRFNTDYPSGIRGPVRTAATVGDRLVESVKGFFKKQKNRSNSAVSRKAAGIDENELIRRIYAPYKKRQKGGIRKKYKKNKGYSRGRGASGSW